MICCNCSAKKKKHLDIDKAHGGPTRCLARLLTVSLSSQENPGLFSIRSGYIHYK